MVNYDALQGQIVHNTQKIIYITYTKAKNYFQVGNNEPPKLFTQ